MKPSKLSTLSDADLEALYDAVLRAPLAIARLAASMPRDRFPFALAALADSGLLQLDVGDERIELRSPYAPRSGSVVVPRSGPPPRQFRPERRRHPRMPERRSRLSEPHDEIELQSLADELGIDEQTLQNNLGTAPGAADRRSQRR